MKVKIHTLFQYLLETTEAEPEAIVGFSLSQPPKLGEFLDDLDPDLPLDWNGASFRGLPTLREHVLREAGLLGFCAAHDVLITAGAAEANYLAIMQLLQPSDEIVIETPGWPQAAVLARAVGAGIQLVERQESQDWRFPMERLAQVVTDKAKIIFVTNPNNPTGQRLSEPELREIVEIASRVGAWVIVDEVYAGLEWQGGPRAPAIAGMYERGITTGSVSKALGLQGLRTGWLICQDKELVMDAVILRENSSEIMNIMGEVIAEIAMRPDRYKAAMAKARSEGEANLKKLDQFIQGEPRLSWVRPSAGLIGLARLDGIDGDSFARRLLEPPYRTFLLPGSAYDQPGHIRLGVGGGTEVSLDEGLSRVSALLADW